MANQTSRNVVAALKRQAALGTPEATGAGASRIRLIDSPGLEFELGEVPSEERRPDLLEEDTAVYGQSVGGNYVTEINPGGEFDLLIESAVRGTLGSLADYSGIDTDTQLKKVETPATPVNYLYTIEQRDIDIDVGELFYDVRLTQVDFSFQPRQRARITWHFMGLNRNILSTAQSPWFTSPSVTTGKSLLVDSASISYKGSPVTNITGMNLSWRIDAGLQDVIGAPASPDVFLNTGMVTGEITAIRQDLQACTDMDAGTRFAVLVVMRAPGTGERLTFAVNLPSVQILGVSAPFLQGNTAKVETRRIKALPPAGASNVIELYTSTATPVAYGS